MDPYTVDVLALLVLGVAFIVAYIVYWYWILQILKNPDHPDYETVKEAIQMSETRQTLDYWWRRP